MSYPKAHFVSNTTQTTQHTNTQRQTESVSERESGLERENTSIESSVSDTHVRPRWTHSMWVQWEKERKSKTNAPVCKCSWINTQTSSILQLIRSLLLSLLLSRSLSITFISKCIRYIDCTLYSFVLFFFSSFVYSSLLSTSWTRRTDNLPSTVNREYKRKCRDK